MYSLLVRGGVVVCILAALVDVTALTGGKRTQEAGKKHQHGQYLFKQHHQSRTPKSQKKSDISKVTSSKTQNPKLIPPQAQLEKNQSTVVRRNEQPAMLSENHNEPVNSSNSKNQSDLVNTQRDKLDPKFSNSSVSKDGPVVGKQGSGPQQCVIPFIYDGITRYTCMDQEGDEEVDMKRSKQWCSLTSNYDRDTLWTPCPKAMITNSTKQNATINELAKNFMFNSTEDPTSSTSLSGTNGTDVGGVGSVSVSPTNDTHTKDVVYNVVGNKTDDKPNAKHEIARVENIANSTRDNVHDGVGNLSVANNDAQEGIAPSKKTINGTNDLIFNLDLGAVSNADILDSDVETSSKDLLNEPFKNEEQDRNPVTEGQSKGVKNEAGGVDAGSNVKDMQSNSQESSKKNTSSDSISTDIDKKARHNVTSSLAFSPSELARGNESVGAASEELFPFFVEDEHKAVAKQAEKGSAKPTHNLSLPNARGNESVGAASEELLPSFLEDEHKAVVKQAEKGNAKPTHNLSLPNARGNESMGAASEEILPFFLEDEHKAVAKQAEKGNAKPTHNLSLPNARGNESVGAASEELLPSFLEDEHKAEAKQAEKGNAKPMHNLSLPNAFTKDDGEKSENKKDTTTLKWKKLRGLNNPDSNFDGNEKNGGGKINEMLPVGKEDVNIIIVNGANNSLDFDASSEGNSTVEIDHRSKDITLELPDNNKVVNETKIDLPSGDKAMKNNTSLLPTTNLVPNVEKVAPLNEGRLGKVSISLLHPPEVKPIPLLIGKNKVNADLEEDDTIGANSSTLDYKAAKDSVADPTLTSPLFEVTTSAFGNSTGLNDNDVSAINSFTPDEEISEGGDDVGTNAVVGYDTTASNMFDNLNIKSAKPSAVLTNTSSVFTNPVSVLNDLEAQESNETVNLGGPHWSFKFQPKNTTLTIDENEKALDRFAQAHLDKIITSSRMRGGGTKTVDTFRAFGKNGKEEVLTGVFNSSDTSYHRNGTPAPQVNAEIDDMTLKAQRVNRTSAFDNGLKNAGSPNDENKNRVAEEKELYKVLNSNDTSYHRNGTPAPQVDAEIDDMTLKAQKVNQTSTFDNGLKNPGSRVDKGKDPYENIGLFGNVTHSAIQKNETNSTIEAGKSYHDAHVSDTSNDTLLVALHIGSKDIDLTSSKILKNTSDAINDAISGKRINRNQSPSKILTNTTKAINEVFNERHIDPNQTQGNESRPDFTTSMQPNASRKMVPFKHYKQYFYSDILKDLKTTKMSSPKLPRIQNVSVNSPSNGLDNKSAKSPANELLNASRITQVNSPYNTSSIATISGLANTSNPINSLNNGSRPINNLNAASSPISNLNAASNPINNLNNTSASVSTIPSLLNATMSIHNTTIPPVGAVRYRTKQQFLPELTFGGNAHGAACMFPFIYDGVTYYTCITTDRDKPWCSTTSSYDKLPKWGYCVTPKTVNNTVSSPERYERYNTAADMPHRGLFPPFYPARRTYGGNGGGKDCVFPFVYDGQIHTDCIPKRDGTAWCAVTRSYDVHPIWGKCCTNDEMRCGGKRRGRWD